MNYQKNETLIETDAEKQPKWLVWSFEQRPGEILHYDKLHDLLLSDHVLYENKGKFFLINPHGKMIHEEWLGWKFHISLPVESAKKAFNLIASILCKYPIAFRILDLDENDNATHRAGSTRFTIYLERNDKTVLSEQQVRDLVEEVTAVLNQHKISPGKPPVADKQTFSPYFSIRNDKYFTRNITLTKQQKKPLRATAKMIGNCYNPLAFENPYPSITKDLLSLHSLFEHYLSLPYSDDSTVAFRITLLAYINKLIDLRSLSDSHLIYEMLSDIQPERIYAANENLTSLEVNNLKFAIRCVHFLECNYFWSIDKPFFSGINDKEFTQDFKEFLQQVQSTLNVSDSYNINISAEFLKWLFKNQDHWFISFCESRIKSGLDAHGFINLLKELANKNSDRAKLLLASAHLKGNIEIKPFDALYPNYSFKDYIDCAKGLDLFRSLEGKKYFMREINNSFSKDVEEGILASGYSQI